MKNTSSVHIAVFWVLLFAFGWVAVKFADMPLVVGAAGFLLVCFLLLIWLPARRREWKKRQKPNDGLDDSDFLG